jgi:integrase
MDAARQLRSPLRSATLETLIGLLAVTGLRVGEVMRLDRNDVDLDAALLLVRNSKGGKSRELPLHPSTVASLRTYSARRDALFPRPQCAAFFISTAGTRLLSGNLRTIFDDLASRAGLLNDQQRRRPRLGELRHSFAIATLTGWHNDGIEIGPRLPLLSSYLGHVNPASTYWYLSATPELLTAAARRLDQLGTSR